MGFIELLIKFKQLLQAKYGQKRHAKETLSITFQIQLKEKKMRVFSSKMGSGVMIGICLLAFCLSMITSVYAHEFWINAPEPKNGLVRADIGYGHAFPKPEPIAADRIHIFKPLQLITPDGLSTLEQSGENYAYQKKENLKKGSYMVIGSYQPTFWSNGPGGWTQTDRTQRSDAVYVEEAIMCAKTIVNVQGGADDNLITKPVGQRLEIVPLINPAKVKVEEKLPLQVLFDGKPAKTVNIEATFDGFSDKGYKAFQGQTDLRGHVDFIPLKGGYWVVAAKHVLDHPDKAKADEVVLVSTFTFQING
jgi:uncharacterized GH25 family protein